MKKKNAVIIISVLSGLLLLSLGATICLALDDSPLKTKPIPNYYANKLTSPYVPETMMFAGEKVPLDVYWVREALDRELIINTYQHSKTIRIIKLSSRVFPVIERILKEEGVPEDFKYLCVAESGLENVVSPASAAGCWQFIPSTAKVYGLTVTNDIDERYNLEKATRAACKYLKKCKNQFGSWTLAAAAYNRGEGGLQAAINSQSCNSYWDLWLNSETSRYVFRILSFKLIFEQPQLYGVEICPAQMYQPIPTKELTVSSSIEDLPKFAHEHGVTYKEVRDLNPWIRNSKLTVPSEKSYTLLLPKKSKENFRTLFQNVENPFLIIGDTVPQVMKNPNN
ncbi:MAG: transglycosylase SLT domain-containing protein [Bacteroidales bacterium]|nr:transglycosylase SLT domain-containing protein [Bacteroidales bacterium]